MTKEDILKYFKDINFAYNDCTKYDSLSNMLDELEKEQKAKIYKIRAEIEDLAYDNEDDDDYYYTVIDALQIIDKYN